MSDNQLSDVLAQAFAAEEACSPPAGPCSPKRAPTNPPDLPRYRSGLETRRRSQLSLLFSGPALGKAGPVRLIGRPDHDENHGGTNGSNPGSSSGESVSLPELLSRVENPGFPRGCARLAWRPGRQRRAGCFKIAPSGGNISLAPYSSTAVPPTCRREGHTGRDKAGVFAELDRAVDRCAP